MPAIKQPVEVSSMARIPTRLLLRSLFLTSLMTSKLFLRPALAVMGVLATSKSPLLNPDRNLPLNKFLRWTVYNHFCAGVNRKEVSKTVADIKKIGYQGVILGYSKEIVLDQDERLSTDNSGTSQYSDKCYQMIEEWKEGTLETLRMVGPGDFLAVKLTGAGPVSVDAMAARQSMPEAIVKAVDEICIATEKQGSRLWLDAEQQVLQHGLDDWAIEMMRKHNKSETPIVYNTIQGYLKGSKANLDHHLTLAAQEGWSLGIKLVRGAYIEHETRSLIHDTQADTDRSYDLIADTLLCQRMPAGKNDLPFPKAALFLATHNAASATKAIATHQNRLLANQPTVMLECGQIQGMADELSCELVQNYERALEQSSAANLTVPKAFKCMTWGSVTECMGYLHRRAIENRGAVERTQHMVTALRRELWRRVVG
ncbi:Proline oxidase [Penicillium expansum]|uniref:Proline dehydrogenase n=1 Tax=Penicillium expansum TaxID=27334 RepID=A0A0A2JK61_PENEN|nr:Proline oxidase [Penicillium expansum]KGO39295.1 Proline oxidase [Penicillium expansum]KGO47203.1 Proline oxidase [Penicillium expansum]KGO55191.1 Proline oxidase [Penicillium expansum]